MAFRDGMNAGFRFEGDELLWEVMNQGDRPAQPGEVIDIVDIYPQDGSPWRLEAPLSDTVEPNTAAINRVRLESSLPDGAYAVQLYLQGGAHDVTANQQFVIRNGRPTFDADAGAHIQIEDTQGGSYRGVRMVFSNGHLPDWRVEGDDLCWDLVNEGDTVAEAGTVVDIVDITPDSGAAWRMEATLQDRVEPGTAGTNRVSLGSLPDGEYEVQLYVQQYQFQVEANRKFEIRNGRIDLNAANR